MRRGRTAVAHGVPGLDAYRIDKTEVTNLQYAQCVTVGICSVPASNISYGNPDYANYTVTFVNWNHATAYCTWVGKRLPSEAEWEKAARGARDAQAYPWGDAAPTCALANYSPLAWPCVGETNAVGNYPPGASPYGALDMAGNVWEWINDWYDDTYYSSSSANINPPGPATGYWRVRRGGGWYDRGVDLRAANRDFYGPANVGSDVGFRCVAAP